MPHKKLLLKVLRAQAPLRSVRSLVNEHMEGLIGRIVWKPSSFRFDAGHLYEVSAVGVAQGNKAFICVWGLSEATGRDMVLESDDRVDLKPKDFVLL